MNEWRKCKSTELPLSWYPNNDGWRSKRYQTKNSTGKQYGSCAQKCLESRKTFFKTYIGVLLYTDASQYEQHTKEKTRKI